MREPQQSTCAIVGIGASAGGLDALRRLLGAIPADPPFAIVVVQHLNPTTRSQLAEIMSRACDLEVVRAKSGDTVMAGTVYVIPEGREAYLSEGRLRLRQASKTCREPIDAFFTSLAEHNEAHGCGVVLSGNGSDGVLGLRQVRGVGGITFAQDPSTAEYPSMPSMAIEAGVADFIGAPEQIARDLLAHVAVPPPPGAAPARKKSKAAVDRDARALAKILGLVRLESGLDFSGYKSTTVMRRVSRRAMLKDADDFSAYLALVEADPAEVSALADDLLINVTQFFRDPEVFESLRKQVLPKLLKTKSDSDSLRIWVVGCSTGEEVYSLLITALEALDESEAKPKITVFGTDASEWAIKRARAGVYPQSICASVSAERLGKYFVRTEAGYEIDRSLREMCVFARQDITKDTPFSRQDLVSLRNVLIYMDQPLQRQVLAVAHFALVPEGLLLLGTSETSESEPRLFQAFDKRIHLYRRQDVAARLPIDVANAARSIDALSVSGRALSFEVEEHDAHAAANEMALLVYAPPRVVVDANGHVLHFFGDTTPFLKHAVGRATLELAEMAHPGIALELKDALEDARATDNRATRDVSFAAGGRKRHVSLEVTPLPSPPGQTQLMVAFRELSTAETALASPATNEDLARLYEEREQRVRGELGALRGRLRAVAEEREHVNQSLRSANEEIRSSNEELQSINEELETAKEELQSANEELITVNDELRQSNREQSQINDDLMNFSTSIEIPLLMLDRTLRVRRFTPQATRVVRIEDSDLGRLLEHLRSRVDVTDLPELATSVIESEEPLQRDVQDEGGTWYSMNLRPYRTAEGHVEGVVIAFYDVDTLKRTVDQVERRARLGDALTAIDADLASTMEFGQIMQCSLDGGALALEADAGSIQLREGEEWVVQYEYGFTTAEVGLRLSEAEAPNATVAARLGEPVMVADMSWDEAHSSGFIKAHGLKSVLAVPLIVRGSTFGCLMFYHRVAAKGFTPDEIEFGRRLATSVSLALENSRLLHAEQDATQRAETLNAINEIIRTAITPEELLGRLVGEASEVAGAEKCLVIEVRDDEFVVTHVRGLRADLVGQPRTSDFFPGFALAARERHPILIEDAWADPRTNKEFVVPYGLKAFQLLPLTVDDTVVAVLALAFDEPRQFSPADVAFSERVCTAMSIALGTALLFQAEMAAQERANQELEITTALLDAAAAIARWTNLGDVVRGLAQALLRSTSHSRVIVSTWDESSRELVVAASEGERALEVGGRWQIDDVSVAARSAVLEQQTKVWDLDAIEADSRGIALDELAMDFALYVPLVQRDTVVGLLIVDNPGERREFSEREIGLVEGIAAQAAVAMENARLFDAEQSSRLAEAQRAERMSLLKEIAEVGSTSFSAADAGERQIEILMRGLSPVTSFLFVADEGRRCLVPLAMAGVADDYIAKHFGPIDIGGPGGSAIAFRAGEPAFVRNVETDPFLSEEGRAFTLSLGQHSGAILPLMARGETVGVLSLAWAEPHALDDGEVAFLESIASEIALGLASVRMFETEVAAGASSRALADVSALLTSSRDVSEALGAALARASEAVGAIGAILASREDGGWRTTQVQGMTVDQIGDFHTDAGSPARRRVFETREPYLVGDVMADPEADPGLADRIGYRAYAAYPLVYRDEVIGALSFFFAEPRREMTATETEFALRLVFIIAAAQQNARSFEIEKTARRRVEALQKIAEFSASSLELVEIVDRAATFVAESLAVDVITFWKLDEEGGTLFPVTGIGFPLEFYDGFSNGIGIDQPFEIARAVAELKPVVRSASQIDLVPAPVRASYAKYGVPLGALLVLPVRSGSRALGAMTLAWREQREISEDEVAFFTSAADEIALGADNAILFEAVREKARLDEALNAIGASIHSTLEFEEIMHSCLGDGVEALNCDSGAIQVREGDCWRVSYQFGFDADQIGRLFCDVEAPCATATMATRRPFVVADATCDAHVSSGFIAEHGVKSVLAVPLIVRDEVTGCMLFYERRRIRGFSGADIDFAVKLAASVSLAIENAQLFESEQRELARTRMLQEVATAVSSSLSLEEICDRALDQVRLLPEVAASAVYVLDEERMVLRNTGVFGYPDDMRVWNSELPVDNTTSPGRVVAQGLVMLTHEDPGSPPGVATRLAHMGVPSARWMVLPMRSGDRLVGAIGLIFHGERPFEPQETAVFCGIADTLSAALANARLFESEVAAQQRALSELARTALLKEIAAIGASTLDPRELAESALGALHRLLGAKTGNIFALDNGVAVLRSLASIGVPKKALAAFQEVPLDSDTATARVARTHEIETHLGRRASQTSARVAKLTGKATGAWIVLPISARGSVIGTLGLSFEEDRPFGTDEVTLFKSVADQLGIALERTMFFTDLEASRQQVTNVLESISDGFYALDRDWRFTYANAEAGRMIGIPHTDLIGHTMLEMLGPDVFEFQKKVFAPAMFEGEVVEFERYFAQTGIWADIRVFPSAEGVVVYGRDITERKVAEQALRETRERAEMMATLLDESAQPFAVGNLDGTMGLVNSAFETLTGYSAEELADVSWASTLTPPEYWDMEAEKLAELTSSGEPVRYEKEYVRKDGSRVPIELFVHLDTDELGEPRRYSAFVTDLTERKEIERLDVAFNEIRTAVGATLEFSQIIQGALTAGSEALGADSAAAFKRETSGWFMTGSVGMPASTSPGPFADDDSLVSPLVAATGLSVMSNDPEADRRLDPKLVRRYRVKSLLAAPLGIKGAELGVLAFFHRKKSEPFNEAQLGFVTRLARVVALAIQNSMLYERERTIADTLQDALLTPPEVIAGIETSYLYRPASSTANVGGDFYDVFSIAENRCVIVVGDVSGKGLMAARLTSLIHDGIRAYTLETSDPVEVLTRLNRLVCHLSPPEQFATLFFGLLDTQTGLLRYSTAGHPAPIVVDADKASYLLGTHSPVLGAFARAPFHCFDTVLARGDRLVLFTDGVTEARRGSEFLGEQRLLKLVGKMTRTPTKRFPQRLLDKVLDFSDGELRDDTVILCVERKPEPKPDKTASPRTTEARP